jgi:anthranilate synthase/aminodeoxychorismate synthase-like glutamine amidotransferase
MTRVLVADNYDSFTYNLAQAFGALGARVEVLRNDEIDPEHVIADPPDAIVVSPGPGRPASAGISLVLVSTMSGRVPVLGVCLGHQVIGEAFGARVVAAPTVVHGKTSSINHDGGALFEGVPSPFPATRYHSLVVDESSLAETPLRVIARSESGTLMALRHKEHPTFGVQFHPESVLTAHGPLMLANFLRLAGSSS